MNRKHVSKVGKYFSVACLLFVCAMVQSCRDEYYFDDREPSFLGASIYNYLEKEGNFTYFLKVIDDLDYALVLSQTGSKTLFVADDEAFVKAIGDEWGVSSYAELTDAQKRVILNSAMLDNAYLLEMLSKQPSVGANSEPTAGLSLRRKTSAVVTDTIPLFLAKDLPQNNEHWDVFRSGAGVRLALDATPTLLTHFTEAQSYMNNITQKDLQLILGDDNAKLTDYYIFDKKVIKGDVTCKNGYVHQLDGLLIPPANMAEEIRKNGRKNNNADLSLGELAKSGSTTYLFSRILDRFSAPVIASSVSEDFNRLYHKDGNTEKVYEKRYFTAESDRGAAKAGSGFLSYNDADGKSHSAKGSLLFDPGWNSYKAGAGGQTTEEQDMAAIFAPSDSALYVYFTEGGGKTLANQFGKDGKNLIEKVDSIPLDIVEALVRNHMQMSFNSTVPSKFSLILNDARDPMNIREDNVVKCMVSNNGVVYVMDTVYSPAKYVAVTAPVMLSDSLVVSNRAIELLQYDKYLLSMGNKFGLVVSSDNAMTLYDPKTEGGDKRYAYKFFYTENGGKPQVKFSKHEYDYTLGAYGVLKDKAESESGVEDSNVKTLLKEVLEYNIIVDDIEACGINLDKEEVYPKYYMSKGYGSVKVTRDANGKVTHIAGGRELQNGKNLPVAVCHEQENGLTLQLDGGMMHPATQSVYKVLQKPEFEKFRILSTTSPSTELLKYIGVSTAKEREKYSLFVKEGLDYNVRMFETYHYTVYVPSNEAMIDAHENKGLPTWEELELEHNKLVSWTSDSLVKLKAKFAESKLEADSLEWLAFREEIKQDSLALKDNVELIRHFVKYHFQDNSVFVDNVRHEIIVDGGKPAEDYKGEKYETSALDTETNKFCQVLVKTAKKGGVETISVRGDFSARQKEDASYNTCYVINSNPADENVLYNVMTRDIEFKGDYVYTSSYAVVHLIDNFLANEVIFDAETNKFKTNK